MPIAQTYEPIGTATLSSNAATVTFTSIPSTYTDLILQASMIQNGTATATNGFITLNSSGTGYSKTILSGQGSSVSSIRGANMDRGYYEMDPDTSYWAFHTYHFMNYKNTNTYKTILSRQNLAPGGVVASVHLWQNTAAITTIQITASDNMGGGTADQFASGSTFTLYGIKAA
jgi:hypothetical protein